MKPSLFASLMNLIRPSVRVRVHQGGVDLGWEGSDEHAYASPLARELERMDRRRRVVALRVIPGGKDVPSWSRLERRPPDPPPTEEPERRKD